MGELSTVCGKRFVRYYACMIISPFSGVGVTEHGFTFLQLQLMVQVWKFLLGSQTYDSTYAEREYITSMKKSEYETIKNQWQVCDLLSGHIYIIRNTLSMKRRSQKSTNPMVVVGVY